MYNGIVKFFNNKNKFGFIIENETKKEYYVHAKDVLDMPITEGDQVYFELREAKRAPECINVKKYKLSNQ